MELFSVACITCRAKLKVRQASAIGQILPCPRCGGMVQITPPPGWKPPAAPPISQPSASTASVSPPTAAARAHAAPSVPSGERADAPRDDADVYTPLSAEVVDAPLSGGPAASSPRERAVRRAIVVVTAIVALLVVSVGVWSSLRTTEESSSQRASASVSAPTASNVKTTPTAVSSSTGSPLAVVPPSPASLVPTALPAPTLAASSAAVPAAIASRSGAAASTMPNEPAAPKPVPSGPTIAAATTAGPSASATTSQPTAPPSGVVAATGNSIPPADAAGTKPPPAVALRDVEAAEREVRTKLATVIPALEFQQTPFRRAVDNVARIVGVRFHYDWSSIESASVLNRSLNMKLASTSAGEVLNKLAEPQGLRFVAVAGSPQFTGPEPSAESVVVDYPIDDLAGSDLSQAETLRKLAIMFVAPTSWDVAGGRGGIVAAAGKLTVSQTSAKQRETALFLDRLRLARGKPPRASSLPSAPTLETRLARAKPSLQKPVTMNFRPAAPLRNVLDRIELGSGLVVVVDGPALEASGVLPDEPVGVAADKAAAFEVLDAVCDPRGWAWHVPVDGVVEITTPEALRRHAYAEFYDVGKLLGEKLTPLDLAAKVRTEIADLPAPVGSTGGETAFDGVSGYLLVGHHQAAHLRVARLLSELSAPASPPMPGGPAVGGPMPTAASTARRP